jgi:hypothetical protein
MNCQDHLYANIPPQALARRWFLKECGVGLGAIALGQLAAVKEAQAARDPLAAKKPPRQARAKNVIFLFMAGAPSHLELFDNKPQLAKFDGTLPPPDLLKGYRAAFINPNSKLLGPKFGFAKYGQSGAELSELLPHLTEVVDDITIVKSMVTDAFNHAPGQILMSTGSQQFGKPSLGSWTLYGLGSETQNLPGFVVFSTGKKGPSGGNSNWGSGFLPTVYQGVTFRTSGDPVLYLSNPPGVDDTLQRDSLDTVNALNRRHLKEVSDPEIATRINSFEMASACKPKRRTRSTFRRSQSMFSRCTARSPASRRSRRLVYWPAAWSSAGCGSSKSFTKPGTSTVRSCVTSRKTARSRTRRAPPC